MTVAAAAAGVAFEGVRKVFANGAVAVEGLDLAIRPGEFVSLLGPSGCGKTTTLRMLAGLEQPTAGRISIGGRVVNELAPGRRDVAMVFQSYALYPHMTVAQNIEYPLKKRRLPRPERAARVKATAALLQLEGLLERKPRQLSGGQQQRVALGRALVRDPAVFLLDEPLSNLDAKLRARMRAELIELRQRIGRTMVYVTHDQLEAMTMSDRIAVMREGVLQQCGTPAEVYDRPANPFVAGFIGTPPMNLVEGRVDEGGTFRAGGLSVPLPAGTARPGDATLGVRPEHVAPAEDGPVAATVRVVEPAGHESIILFDAAGHGLTARLSPELRLAPGEPVRLRLKVDRLHLFPGGGGRSDGAHNEETGR